MLEQNPWHTAAARRVATCRDSTTPPASPGYANVSAPPAGMRILSPGTSAGESVEAAKPGAEFSEPTEDVTEASGKEVLGQVVVDDGAGKGLEQGAKQLGQGLSVAGLDVAVAG